MAATYRHFKMTFHSSIDWSAAVANINSVVLPLSYTHPAGATILYAKATFRVVFMERVTAPGATLCGLSGTPANIYFRKQSGGGTLIFSTESGVYSPIAKCNDYHFTEGQEIPIPYDIAAILTAGGSGTYEMYFTNFATDPPGNTVNIGVQFSIEIGYTVQDVASSADLAIVDGVVDTILVDTNEIQTKLPTNNIMGSSDKDNHDGDIDSILVDTNEIQTKLPTQNIMGSTVKISKDTVIDATYAKQFELQNILYPYLITVQADVGNTALTFKTNIAPAYANDYFNDMQAYFVGVSSTNEMQVRRISDYDAATQFITLDVALFGTPLAGEQFYILPRWTPAGSSLTPAGIAAAVMSEPVPGSYTGNMAGKVIADTLSKAQDIETDTQDIQARLPASLNSGRMRSHVEAKDSTLPLSAQEKADVNAEVDVALVDYDPPTRTEATSDKNEIIAEVNANEVKIDAVKNDTAAILIDTNEVQTKLPDNNIMGSSTKTDKDDEIDAILADTAAIDARLPSDPADQSLVEDKIDQAVDDLDGLDDRDHTEIYNAITAIGSNTRLKPSVPEYMQKPDTGSIPYRWSANLYALDGSGMEDPDNNEILVRVLQVDGTPITANLYQDDAMTTPLADPTDTIKFNPANGWRAMVRLGTGRYELYYKISDTETEEALSIEFGWTEGGSDAIIYPWTTIISDVRGDIEDIQVNVQDIHDKLPDEFIMGSSVTTSKDDEIDSILEDTGTTIPAQIDDQTAIIKALPRVEACPDLMFVPYGRTRINQEDGITAVATEIPVLVPGNLLDAGLVKIEDEYIIYGSIVDNELQVTQRGAYGTTPAIHANSVDVKQSVVFPVRLVTFNNEGNMITPDSAPTLEIEDWNGTQELAPTAMTLISTGVYGYNYIIDHGALAENKIFKFVVIVDGNTRQVRHEVVIMDQPASEVSLIGTIGGGSGDFVITQDGWYDVDGILHEWTDALKGFVRDADTGAPLNKAYVTAYLYENGEVLYNGRPPGQAKTRVNGTWIMFLDAYTYQFVFEKDGFRIAEDGTVLRTVG